MIWRSLATAAAALALLSCSGRQPAAADVPPPVTHTVVIEALRFQPETLSVKVGDSVVWANKDPFPHTATSATGGFDSREIAAGASWKYTAVKTGEFPYVCSLHPTMKAVLRVE